MVNNQSDSITTSAIGNVEVEYTQALSYIQHMYDTRHRIFQFAVALNTALLGVVFQFIQSAVGRFALSMLGLIVTLAMVLMAKRSGRFTSTVETYAKTLEQKLGFGLVTETAARMPKGIDSSKYLYFVYWMLVATWVALGVYFLVQV